MFRQDSRCSISCSRSGEFLIILFCSLRLASISLDYSLSYQILVQHFACSCYYCTKRDLFSRRISLLTSIYLSAQKAFVFSSSNSECSFLTELVFSSIWFLALKLAPSSLFISSMAFFLKSYVESILFVSYSCSDSIYDMCKRVINKDRRSN